MFDIEKILAPIRNLKKSAKAYGKLDSFEEGIRDIQQAIEELLSEQEKLPESQKKLTPQLFDEIADSYGIQGGIYRRWGLDPAASEVQKKMFKLSYESYDIGYDYEKKGSKLVSYNLLNRLVSRVFFEPSWLSSAGAGSDEYDFLSTELHACLNTIDSQRKERENDIWFFSDMGLNKILLKEEDPNKAYAEFMSKAPIDTDYTSIFAVLRPLSELPTDVQDHVKKAIDYITDQREKKKKSLKN